MHNVEVTYRTAIDGELSIYYGSCDADSHISMHHALGRTHIGNHPLAKRHADHVDQRPTKFVWLPPVTVPSGGCLLAFIDDALVGKSAPFNAKKRMAKRAAAFADVADAMGPWFDGVEYLQQKEPENVFVSSAKSKSVGIIGGGMSGLMSAVSILHIAKPISYSSCGSIC